MQKQKTIKFPNTMFGITVDFIILNVWHRNTLYFESHTKKQKP